MNARRAPAGSDPVDRMIREAKAQRRRVLASWRAAHASRSIAASLNGGFLMCADCIIPDPADEDLEVVSVINGCGSPALRIATSEDIRRHGCCHSCGRDLLPALEGVA
jgi:hypothetical protein